MTTRNHGRKHCNKMTHMGFIYLNQPKPVTSLCLSLSLFLSNRNYSDNLAEEDNSVLHKKKSVLWKVGKLCTHESCLKTGEIILLYNFFNCFILFFVFFLRSFLLVLIFAMNAVHPPLTDEMLVLHSSQAPIFNFTGFSARQIYAVLIGLFLIIFNSLSQSSRIQNLKSSILQIINSSYCDTSGKE